MGARAMGTTLIALLLVTVFKVFHTGARRQMAATDSSWQQLRAADSTSKQQQAAARISTS